MISIPAGTTWAYGWPILDQDGNLIDLTGWSAYAQIRANKWIRDLPVLHEWTSEGPDPNISLLNSTITIHVSAEESSAWTWWDGAFQLKLIDDLDRVSRIDEFEIQVSPDGVY